MFGRKLCGLAPSLRRICVSAGVRILDRRIDPECLVGSRLALRLQSPRRMHEMIIDEVKALSSDDIAMLVRIRRMIARVSSDMYGACDGCGATIEPERLCSHPEADRCVACVC